MDDSLSSVEEDVLQPARSHLGFPVVGIGASAGGLAALQSLFAQLPSDAGMAYVVILHLSPTHESHIDHILQRVTRMPVLQVTERVAIAADHVYVIAPTQALTMDDGHLVVGDLSRPRGRHVAIDLFFRTLARAHRERAIGIVLSGTGADGSVGLRTVKEEGGVTIAQSPRDAEHDAMPLAAIATGVVDLVLPVEEIGKQLLTLWRNASRIELPDAEAIGLDMAHAPGPDDAPDAEQALREIMVLLHERTGHDFRHYKRATVLRRIERRLQVNALPDLPSYRDFLAEHVKETTALLQDLLISVTNFFRDAEVFEALQRELKAQCFDSHPTPSQMRVWVAGCATGEEAYSVAMVVDELASLRPRTPMALQVFASDIDERALAVGRAGVYPESIVTDVAPARLRRYFSHENASYRIRKPLREEILFTVHNVLRDPPFSRLDLVCCRNLLIYLDRDIQASVLEVFHFALQSGGLLVLGSSETPSAAPHLFSAVDKRHRIYRANAVRPAALRTLPSLVIRSPGSLDTALPVPAAMRSPYEQLHQRLVERYAPPTMLVDGENTIVHMVERAGRYLRHVGGAPSYDLLQVIRPELRPELRTALFQARQSGHSVEARRVHIEREDRHYLLRMSVQPVRDADDEATTRLALVIFAEVETTLADEPGGETGGKDPLIVALEAELQKTSDRLHGSIDESEASAEALRASNEELQAINEELRSATEELETSKEELQSVNEELVTVNFELKSKVDETVKVNDDLQNLMAATDIATVFVDAALHIKRYTPRAAELFNLIEIDVGRSLMDITHRLDYSELVDDAAEAFGTLRVTERRVRSTAGRWYLARLLPYRTADHRIEGAVLTFVDITALQEAEDSLRVREERFRLVVDSTRDYAILTIDLQGRVTSWNLGAQLTFGYTEAEMLGQSAAVIFTPEDRADGAPERELGTARRDGRAEDERWHLRKDGSRFYCSGIMTRLGDADHPSGFAKIARDLTDRKRLEGERETLLSDEEELRRQVETAAASKDEFLAVMSHELKNPLNLIQLNAELLERMPEVRDVPTVRRSAEVIRRTVMSQAQIIDDLLDLSRLSTGKLALGREAVSWPAVIERIASAVRPDAVAKGVQLDLQIDASDAFVVDADPVRLEQIVWNLVSNALKFTSEGGRIEIALHGEGRQVRLDVTDTGRGIEPEFVDHVFEMFRQRDSRTTRRDGGLGIGLALVSSLAQLHGGTVAVASEGLGRGARFSVCLPRFDGDSRGEAAGGLAEPLQGLRILLVDDAEDTVDSFAMLLTLQGAEVATAGGGAAALERLAQQDFDLVVSDIGMPDMDGYQLIAELRRQERNGKTIAIAVTGFGRPSDARSALAAGFDAHLSKPLGLEALLAQVRRLLP